MGQLARGTDRAHALPRTDRQISGGVEPLRHISPRLLMILLPKVRFRIPQRPAPVKLENEADRAVAKSEFCPGHALSRPIILSEAKNLLDLPRSCLVKKILRLDRRYSRPTLASLRMTGRDRARPAAQSQPRIGLCNCPVWRGRVVAKSSEGLTFRTRFCHVTLCGCDKGQNPDFAFALASPPCNRPGAFAFLAEGATMATPLYLCYLSDKSLNLKIDPGPAKANF